MLCRARLLIYHSNKGKRVFEEEQEVYSRNIRAHKPDVPFVNLNKSDIAVRFNKVARCLLSKVNMEHLDSMDLAVRKEQAHTTLAEVWPDFLVSSINSNKELT